MQNNKELYEYLNKIREVGITLSSSKKLNEVLKENLQEGSFIEGKMLDKKSDSGVVGSKSDNDVISKKAKKIADLINKLDKDDIKKIKNLLETE